MVKKKVSRRRARDQTDLEQLEVAKERGKFVVAFYRYHHRDRRGAPLVKEADAFLAKTIGISPGSASNIRLGSRNLSSELAQKLKDHLGTASVEIDPFVLTFREKRNG